MSQSPRIPLPKGWPTRVKSAMLHVISLAQDAAVYTHSWAVDSTSARVRLAQLHCCGQVLRGGPCNATNVGQHAASRTHALAATSWLNKWHKEVTIE